jgi:hypothetical protein
MIMVKTWDEIRAENGKIKDYQADGLYHSNTLKHRQVVNELIEHEEIGKVKKNDKVYY